MQCYHVGGSVNAWVPEIVSQIMAHEHAPLTQESTQTFRQFVMPGVTALGNTAGHTMNKHCLALSLTKSITQSCCAL